MLYWQNLLRTFNFWALWHATSIDKPSMILKSHGINVLDFVATFPLSYFAVFVVIKTFFYLFKEIFLSS